MPAGRQQAIAAWFDALPTARAPATLGEAWRDVWGATGLNELTGGTIDESFNALTQGVMAAVKPRSYADLFGGSVPADPDEQASRLGDIVGGLPEAQRKPLEPLVDFRARASEKAQALERQAAETRAVTYGLDGWATMMLAGLARQAVDPVNVATMLVGGPLEGSIAKMLAREALLGGASQAVQEPFIQAKRAELGLDAGASRAAADIAGAAAGGAAFSALLRGAGAVVRFAFARDLPAPRTAVEAPTVPAPGAARPIEEPLPSAFDSAAPWSHPLQEFTGGGRVMLSAATAEDFSAAALLSERDEALMSALDGAPPWVSRYDAPSDLGRVSDSLERGRPLAAERPEPETTPEASPQRTAEERPTSVTRAAEEAAAPEPRLRLSDVPLGPARAAPQPAAPAPPAPREAAAPKPLGDPELAAEAARVTAEAGGDFKVHLDPESEGEAARVVDPAAETRAIGEEGAAIAELEACIGIAVKEAAE